MTRKLAAILATIAVFMATVGASNVSAQEPEAPPPENPKQVEESPTGSYIVVMVDDPIVAELGAEAVNSPAADAMAAELEETHDEVLEDADISTDEKVQGFTSALNGFSATLSHDEAVAVAADSKVALVLPDELRQATTDSSGDFLGLTDRGEAYASGVTGAGVVIGVIDSGIWPEHPSFADTGFPAPPVALEDTPENPSCEFGNTAHNPDDAPFSCNNKLIGARQMLGTYRALIGADPDEFDSARDDDGHGTHTASTAAGNANVPASIGDRDFDAVTGIAPDAHIIAYKGLGRDGGFTSDLVSAIDQAVVDGVDVINYSVGGGAGLNGGDAIAFLFAADAGVMVATSAGNSGSGDATVGGPGDVPWITTVGASTQSRFYRTGVRLGNGRPYYGASISSGIRHSTTLVDAEFAGGDLCLSGTLDPEIVKGNIVLCRRGAVARVEKSLAVYEAGGVGMILYNNDNVGDLITDTHWVPGVHTDLDEGLEIKAYIASARRPTARFDSGRSGSTRAPIMALFSSRGPNPSSGDVIKPDITAPGVQILAGASPFVEPGSVPGELFQAIAGTSMSSPHVAGVFALLKQVHPDWSAAMAKSAVMTSSYQRVLDNDRATPANPFQMGAGHLDPGRTDQRGSAFNPGLTYDTGLLEYAGFSCAVNAGIFTAELCDLLDGAGLVVDPSDLNLPSISIGELPGTQTVTRSVTSVSDYTVTYRAKVDAPAGYDVTVSPSEIRVAPGETVTFQTTIANDGSGAIGEWSFGSLTWKGSGIEVYSPIAVRGSLFDSPSTIIGAGTEGSASFDVTFGYTGDYSAAPHGLVGAEVLTDTVVQDPDQDFDPTDGFSNAHTFDLTGAAYFRLALPPESTEANADLDVFVYDPAGNLVAQSTASGTNEQVDLVLPAAGVWTVYIHGWATIDGESTYDLSTWTVSATPGGSLSLDTAPSAATVGATGPIDLSWSGLSAGENYLGAVSHNDGDGIIGFTLVEVNG